MNHNFERLSFCIIILNSGVFVYSINRYAATLIEQDTSTEKVLEGLFLCFFTVELLLKLSVHRWFFFINCTWAWNWFDFIIVSISLFEMVMKALGVGGHSITFVRVYRALRVAR